MHIRSIILALGLVSAVAALPQDSPGETTIGDGDTGAAPTDDGTGSQDTTTTAGDIGSSPTEAPSSDPTVIFYAELTVGIQSIIPATDTASAKFDSALSALP